MEELIEGWPFWAAFAFLFCGAFIRGCATYWVGSLVRRGGERSRFADRLAGPVVVTARRWVARFGAPVVSLGFLTVGFQTAINASAGLLAMPLRRFIPAVVVGAIFWATLYTTVGLAVIDAAVGRVPWWWALVALGVVVLVVLVSRFIVKSAAERASGPRGGSVSGDGSGGDSAGDAAPRRNAD